MEIISYIVEIVKATLEEDLSIGLEPDGLAELDTVRSSRGSPGRCIPELHAWPIGCGSPQAHSFKRNRGLKTMK
jgi:hypothetical protein